MKKVIQVSSCERGKLHFLAENPSTSFPGSFAFPQEGMVFERPWERGWKLRSEQRNNKLYQTFSVKSGVEPGPRWWKTSSLINAPTLRSNWGIRAYFYDTEDVCRDEVGIVTPLSHSRHFGIETRLVGHQNTKMATDHCCAPLYVQWQTVQ